MVQLNPHVMFILNGYRYRPLIDLDLGMFLSMVPNLLNFILIAVLLTWLLYKPVKKLLQTRADRVEGDMRDAALSKASAEELKAQYEQKVRDIENERADILEAARKLTNEKRLQILDEAKAEADELRVRASKDVERDLQAIKSSLHQSIIDISTEMAEKLVAVTIDKNAHDRLFAEAMAELEATAFRPLDKVAAV